MAEVVYAAAAFADLERLVSFGGRSSTIQKPGVPELCMEAIELLARHPELGRRVALGYRELVISRGRTGYLALYSYDPRRDVVCVLRLRHQREAGYEP